MIGINYGANLVIDSVYSKAEIGNPEQVLGFKIDINNNKANEASSNIGDVAKTVQDIIQPQKLNLNYENKSGNLQTYQSLKIEMISDLIIPPPCNNSIEEVQKYFNAYAK